MGKQFTDILIMIAAVIVVMPAVGAIAPYYGGPAMSDSPMWYASSAAFGVAGGYALRVILYKLGIRRAI